MATAETSTSPLPEASQIPTEERERGYSLGLIPAEYSNLELADTIKDSKSAQSEVASGPGDAWHNESDDRQPPDATPPQPDGDRSSPTDAKKKDGKRICGIRPATFWVGIVLLIFFLGTISASAAAGLTAKSLGQMEQKYEAQLSACRGPHPWVPNRPTSTVASGCLPLPSVESGVNGETTPNCPGIDPQNNNYTSSGTGVLFKRECGINYPKYDLGSIPLTSMEDCMNLCAALKVSVTSASGSCKGVVWLTDGRQGEDTNACYLKYKKGDREDSSRNTEAAWVIDKT